MFRKKETEELRVSKATRFGSLIAIVSLLSIGSIEVFKRVEFLHARVIYGVSGVAVAGIILLLLKFERYWRKSTPEEVLQFHKNPHYWGLALVITAVVIQAFCPPYEPVQVMARELPEKELRIPEEPVVFPDLEVSAVVVNGDHSSATINRREVWLGEDIMGVKLVKVSETNVTVELRGVTREITCFEPVKAQKHTVEN